MYQNLHSKYGRLGLVSLLKVAQMERLDFQGAFQVSSNRPAAGHGVVTLRLCENKPICGVEYFLQRELQVVG